ncbi:MAG: ATP synthase F0 subunit B [Desulfovibrionaceae bacterium]|nr:ATP synthase F0 subunit B [Desulfovibrionaceae bacterium]
MDKWKTVGVAAALVLLSASAAFAAHDAPRWDDLGWRVLNLIIFGAILWKFIGKLAVNYFTGRRKGIQQSLDDLAARREAAKKGLDDIEAQIANLDAERKAILDESVVQGEAQKQAIVAEAHKQAEQIVEQARRTAENEGRAILQEVRATIADEIVDAAEKVLASKLDARTHDKLITNSLTKVVLN